jgi:hypothetical protein
MAEVLPVVVLLDDSIFEMRRPFDLLLARIGEKLGFETRLFGDSDAAIEFTLKNVDRVFMFVQDSARRTGSIISAWKAILPGKSVSIGTESGDFYKYVIDGFAPQAGVVFSGFSYREEELEVLHQWSELDERIVVANKMAFTSLRDDSAGLGSIAPLHLEKWRTGYRTQQAQLSADGRLTVPLYEEMAMLCVGRPEYLQNLTSRQFEELVAALFKNHGFDVELTGQTRDGGYDIVAASNTRLEKETTLIEVKHFAPCRPVGVGIVRALYGVKHLRSASKAMLVTSSYVSRDAHREFSRVIPWEMELIERDKLLEWVATYAKHILVSRLEGPDVHHPRNGAPTERESTRKKKTT